MTSTIRVDTALTSLFGSIKRFSTRNTTTGEYLLTQHEVDDFYRSHRFLQNIINYIPQDCCIQYPKLNAASVDVDNLIKVYKAIEAIAEPLIPIDIQGAFMLAMQYGRLYGDGFIFLGINDGMPPDEPVNLQRIKSVDWVAVKHRYQVGLDYLNDCFMAYIDPLNPKLPSTLKFHSSRVLRFSGVPLYGQLLNNNGGFNDSIFNSVYKQYLSYTKAIDFSGEMLATHSIFKYQLKGLKNFLVDGGEAALKARFEAILAGLQAVGGLMFDQGTEEAEFISRNYSGVRDILEHLQECFIGASGMPRSKVFGNASANALSEGSEGDRWTWNEIIYRNQKLILKPNQLKLFNYILASQGIYDAEFDIDYHPHYQLTEKEHAEIRKINADTDKLYFDMGLSATTILESRFGGSEYGMEIILKPGDLAMVQEKEELAKQAMVAANEAMLNPDTPDNSENGEEE